MDRNEKIILGITIATVGITGVLAWKYRKEIKSVASSAADKAKEIAADTMDTLKATVTGSHFDVKELCKSSTAEANGIDNTPTPEAKKNLETLITQVLEPVRNEYGKAIIVSSGYRCVALNKKIGGVSNSQHTTGQAADLVPSTGGSLAGIFKAAVKVGKYDQLIWETNGKTNWVHISYDSGKAKQRMQILQYKGGAYTDISKTWQNIVK